MREALGDINEGGVGAGGLGPLLLEVYSHRRRSQLLDPT